MSFETLMITREDAVAHLWLSRPEKRNAMSERMLDELTQAAISLSLDDSVRVVVLAGQGDVFCAGGDLEWMRAQIGADASTRAAGAQRISDMLLALDQMPKPLIGRVQGNAFGGGVGLMAVCDSVVAAEGTRFGLTETRLGLVPATIGPYVVARIGIHARRYFFTPRLFDAEEARRIGLVSQVVEAPDLDEAIAAEVEPCLAAGPASVARGKALERRLRGGVDQARTDAAMAALIESWEHPEATQGISAFFDKSAPPWAES